jgi:hypothetical protein
MTRNGKKKKKAGDKSVWAIILQEALFKLCGLYASEEEEILKF